MASGILAPIPSFFHKGIAPAATPGALVPGFENIFEQVSGRLRLEFGDFFS